ncbi:hypothetical protein BCR41DRAFT_344088 [Lobosporangium transversale]|uniref:Myb-like domain-containing protein n=1 Tax=Lobosporangium transversale TaxID=64571 RepID=A0A1Y2H2L4_9FUNG|nr:hypothetical protein BCR41DRAFT_344088 [Lobosporangium transversale]ORZ28797.1 hypothetical protein BCR41DRAFT_344088 [Lobosporangium transversale]|eukprot:XP_021886470.1 hypothetical protein BCR41DRAFT_344088 [Lobosporangium transversale]
MDDLVLHVQTEVALDGESGCSWSRFWFLVDQFLLKDDDPTSAPSFTGAPQSFTDNRLKRADEKFRLFFWSNFVQEDGVSFYNHSVDNSAGSRSSSKERSDDSKASFIPFNELIPLDPAEISYTNVTEKYAGTIRIVASAEQQRAALLGYSGAAFQISNQAFQVLQSIAAARDVGATQAQLAKLLKVDPRSMFHFLKVLIEMKLIVKIPVTTDGQYTLLCLHVKFADMNPGYKAMNSESDFASAGRHLITGDRGQRFEGLLKTETKKVSYYSGLIKQKLTDILGRAKNQAMSIDDLAKALDLTEMNIVQNRWFNRQIELLCKLKYIKRVHVPGVYRCIQLLRPYGTDMPVDENEREKINLRSVIADDTSQSGIYMDTSIEHQVYKHIIDSKEKGVIAKEIRHKMDMLNVRLLARILETLSKPMPGTDKPLVKRVVEFVGRERRYRYYSEHGFKTGVAEDHREYIEKAKSFPVITLPPRAAGVQKGRVPISSDTQASQTTILPAPATTIITSQLPTDPTGSEQPLLDTATSFSSGSTVTQPANGNTTTLNQTPELTTAATPERFISVALLKRRKVILSILERKRIIELHHSLVQEYQEEKHRLYPNEEESSVIDRKTLYRTISILEAEGLIKLYKVQNILTAGGNMLTKTFCLHPSVDPESEEGREFMKECSNRQVLFGAQGPKSSKKAEKIQLEVESLDEIQRRLGQDFYKGPSVPSVPFADLGPPVTKTRTDPKQKQTRGQAQEPDGLDTAVTYGWSKAKMMRALVFHRMLLDKLASTDQTLYNFADRPNVFSTSKLFDAMQFRVFLIVVGIVQVPTDEAKAFLDQHRKSCQPLNSLPDFMQPYVSLSTNFKKRLREALEILDALGLVSPLVAVHSFGGSMNLGPAPNHLVLNTHYEVHTNVKAPLDPVVPDQLDHELEGRKQYKLLMPDECKAFWTDLQASASVMKYMPKERSIDRSWEEIRRDFLLNLCNKRIWAEPIQITPSQAEKLMTQVNTKIRFAPAAHDPKIDQMAKETGLPREHVIQYYKTVASVWHANPIRSAPEKAKRLPRVRKARQTIINKQDDTTSMIIKQEVEDTPSITGASSSNVATNASQTLKMATTLDGGRFSVGKPKKSRARRVVWTDMEDERLLLACAIVRCMSETFNTKFSWQCVSNSFNGSRARDVCRHRYAKLIREPHLYKQVESYRAQFSYIFPTLAEQFDIKRKLDEYDPSALIAYFQPNEGTPMPKLPDASPLLNNPAAIERLNYVRQNERFSSIYLEEKLHPDQSLPRRLRLINRLPPTLRTNNNMELDNSPEELDMPQSIAGNSVAKQDEPKPLIVRQETRGMEHTILAVIKAIYCLPRHKRPRSMIRSILSCFVSSKVLETCELAKEWKILTSIKNASYRIPGQKVGRSERFSTLMNGIYPRKLTAAASDIDQVYHQASERLFPLDAGPAEMMVFLNDIAMGWLQVSMARPIEIDQSAAYEEPYGQGALHHFGVNMKNTRDTALLANVPTSIRLKRVKDQTNTENLKEMEMQPAPHKSSETLSDDDDKDPWQEARREAQIIFQALHDGLSIETSRCLYKAIYEIICDSCTVGIVPQDIKRTLISRGFEYSDKEIMECIQKLKSTSPPVVMKVGMAYTRFVGYGWHQTWTLNYKVSMESQNSINNPKDWILPRMWRTLEGAIDESIFETSLHAILSHIAEKPGISKGALLKQFHKLILSVELDDLIEELERRGAIEARSGILPRQTTLFSRREEYKLCDKDTIDERKITNYFAVPAYYSFVDMSLVVGSSQSGTDTLDTPFPLVAEGEEEEEEEEEEMEDWQEASETLMETEAEVGTEEQRPAKKARSQ